MWKSANNEEADFETLEQWLTDNWGLYGGYDSYDAWIIWRRSNYVVYPFSGGYFEQPKFIRDDFLMLDLRRQWHELNAKKPDTAGVASPYD